ncbi:MAG TPA: proton-conducting transporter membrane subunit, partial [Intrasporangium sp.]|nr:proton-conducting transporter membrane subunit [Intrasporangium sp.]
GVALASEHGTAGAIFYVAHHITIQTALFLITGLVERLGGTTSLDRLGGLAAASPVLAILFFTSAMNLSGIPPLSGFLAKIGLLHAGLELGTPMAWVLVVAGIVTSLLTLYALSKVWSQAFWRSAPHGAARDEELGGTAGSEELARTPVSVGQGAGARTDSRGEGLATGPRDFYTDPPRRRRIATTQAARPLPRAMLWATAAMTADGVVITLVAGPLFAYTQRAATDLMQRDPYITSVLPPEVRR